MNENEWNDCTDPQKMLEWLSKQGTLSERKSRLFAVACCRRIWHLLRHDRSQSAVRVAERYADRLAGDEELTNAVDRRWMFTSPLYLGSPSAPNRDNVLPWAARAAFGAASPDLFEVMAVFGAAAVAQAFSSTPEEYSYGHNSPVHGVAKPGRTWYAIRDKDIVEQCYLFRDLFDNPFRPLPPLDRSLFTWNGGLVTQLANAAYEERMMPCGHLDPARLAVLADALEESGCTDAQLLGHLRAGPHVRGCFALDAVLGRS